MTTDTYMPDLLGNVQTIKVCLHGDVKNHFEKIRKYIPAEEEKEFLERMCECIDMGTAFNISDNCFLYYKNTTKYLAQGIALYGQTSPLQILTLFAGVFYKIDTDTFKMDFLLHPGKFAEEYKSLLTITSIKRNCQKGSPLVIRIDKLKAKIKAIYDHKEIS